MARLGGRPCTELGGFVFWVAKGFSGSREGVWLPPARPGWKIRCCSAPPGPTGSGFVHGAGAGSPWGTGGSHRLHPSGIALHHRLDRPEGNKHSPIISPLIGLWIFASVLNQSCPARWAQPGAAPLRAHHRDAASSQHLLLLQLPPRSIPVPTPAPAPRAPSPQLSTLLGMSPKATFSVRPLGRWPGAAGC